MSLPRVNSTVVIAFILFLFGETALLFFTPREDVFQLCFVYFALFVAMIVLYHEVKNIRTAAFIGVFTRCLAWLAFPVLSDDIFRFIWDGTMILEGFNPFLSTPRVFLSDHAYPPFSELFPLLNSQDYFSVYPTVIQFFSAFGALASNDLYLSSLIIKLPILLAEIGTIWMLPKVLMRFKISPKYSVIYMLNPLIIVDVVANAHFEAVMIFFMVLSIKLIQEKKFFFAGSAMALAVATKLIPLLFVPFLIKSMINKERIHYSGGFILVLLIAFFPLLNLELMQHFWTSITLYFQLFEFNASFYYLARGLSYLLVDYNAIAFVGPALAIVAVGIMLFLFLDQKASSIQAALNSSFWALFIYLLLATTVHPWYIAPLLFLGLFNRNYSAIVWSALVILSYNAYGNADFNENLFLIEIEYVLLGFFVWKPQLIKRLFSSTIQ